MNTFMDTVDQMLEEKTARVIINGLAILCFSNSYERAEVGFLQVKDHPLTLTIYDKDCNMVKVTPDLQDGTTIDINPDKSGLGALYCPTDGDEPENSDKHDFRHLLNLDKLHAEFFPPGKIGIKPESTFLATLYLRNAVFFNALKSKNKAMIFSLASRKRHLDKIGKVIGADLNDDEVVIKINSETFHTLTKDAGYPYTVIIRYKCEGKANKETDFQEFHRVLSSPPEHRLDLSYNDVEPAESGECEKMLLQAFTENKLRLEGEDEKAVTQLIENLRSAEEACQGAVKPECPSNLFGEPEPCP